MLEILTSAEGLANVGPYSNNTPVLASGEEICEALPQ
jgi:hypothetical protein